MLAALAGRVAAAPAAVPPCTTAGLVAWLETPGSGTAGSVYYQLELTNLTGHACTLAGYPGVSGVDRGGRRLGSAAGRDAAHVVRVVTLARGASATAILQITDVYNFPAASCGRVLAAGLRVYPPNQTASELVPYPFEACARGGPAYLHVEAVQAGLPPIR